jgi:serine/threonine protein phosphatase PrpC
MAVRFHTNLGFVPEDERLDSSPDTVLVQEPTVGAIGRSKGNLYAIATARGASERARDATRLVLETIGREYYYDESAGIPICLEKAIRTANSRLAHRRDLHLPAAGGIALAVAVLREHELYVATVGDADAFLARQGQFRTLPAGDRGPGLPTAGQLRVEVWRGELLVGDVLLLASGELTARLGTKELRQAITTLHPALAAEHLHHRLIEEGGQSSDALLVVEASEAPAPQVEHQLVPVRPAEPLAGAPERSPIPPVDSVADGVSAVRGTAWRAGHAGAGALVGLVDRAVELLPRRSPDDQHERPATDRRASERRLATVVLAVLALLLVVGVGYWGLSGGLHGKAAKIQQANAGEQALAAARSEVAQVFGGSGTLVQTDPQQALITLREAWQQLYTAQRAGVAAGTLQVYRDQVSAGLDQLYGTVRTAATTLVTMQKLDPAADLSGLVQGPDGAAYAIDRAAHTVVRFDLAKQTAAVIVREGDGGASGVGDPWLLTVGGPDLVIVDHNGAVWRWRPADRNGHGTLGAVAMNHSETWGSDVTDVETFVENADAGLYNLYVVDPSSQQILRYEPAADGSGFPTAPTGYLATATDVSGIEQLFIDGDIYTLATDTVTRFVNGRPDPSFTLAVPPDDQNLRPGHHYGLLTASATRGQGTLYVYDATWNRVIAFDKATGAYQSQYIALTDTPAFADLRGMFLLDPGGGTTPSLVWVTQDRLMVTPLQAAPTGAAALPSPSPSPRATKRPSTRRTPRPTKRP